jgi:hypothetical protein
LLEIGRIFPKEVQPISLNLASFLDEYQAALVIGRERKMEKDV